MVELFTDDAWIIAVSAIAIALAAVAAWLSGRPDDQSDDDPADH
jgi:hypothetical protein